MQEKYKLLAFITLFKFKRENSILYRGESLIALAKVLGISYNTFKKYIVKSHELGILNSYGKHQQFVKLTKVIKILQLESISKHNRFYKHTEYDNISFKNIYKKIIKSIILNNYKQQQWKINKKEYKIGVLMACENNSNLSGKAYSTLKQLKKDGTDLNRLQSQTNHNIITGKFHVANLIGYSSTSGSNYLKLMVRDKDI